MAETSHTPIRDPLAATDIRRSVAERVLPSRFHPYVRLARLDRPIGTWLLLLPCWWGIALALADNENRQPTDWWLAAAIATLFAFGALAMRGAGCTYNDIVDRDIDVQVARTALRPIPTGEVSLGQAWGFLGLQLAVGTIVLFSLNPVAILVGLGSVPIVLAYPFAKRLTHWPQAVLGLAFNWGVLVGFSALTETLSLSALLLYAAGVAWTLGYDTIYAHQDREDDALVGVKSTALLFREASKRWVTGFYAAVMALIGASGLVAGLGPFFWLAFPVVAGHFVWQLAKLNIHDPDDCLAKFQSNRDVGLLVVVMLFLGAL